MTTLRVIVDEMLSTAAGGVARYTEELTRELIDTAPRGVYVEAFVAASTEAQYARVLERLPGLTDLHKSALERRELNAAWQHGFTRLPGTGIVHAPSLFAPLARHDRLNASEQIAVTVHDTIAWTNPGALTARQVAWHKAMVKRAERYADAIVVTSHTVADQLSEIAAVGDRLRVISGAPSSALRLPHDADLLAAELELPERYVLAFGGLDAGHEIDHLIHQLPVLDVSVPLLIVGPAADDAALAAAVADAGVPESRVRGLGRLTDQQLSVVLSRATVFAYPNVEEGFGMPVLDAFALGTPVVHSDAPAILELSAGAGLAVDREADGYAERVAEAIGSVLADSALAARMK
ncbi:MAG: glycosyltransferase, partial [Rhodoglobus sp.]